MKKRWLLISLVLVLALTMLMPATALARNDGNHGHAAKDFSGAGLLYVTAMPAPVIKGNIWRFDNEIVEGVLQASDWGLLAGAGFWSTHDSFVYVSADGSARGLMRGTFKLLRPDGELNGFFEGKISGNLYLGLISDAGMWRSTGGTGVFEGVKAWGKWSANLDPVTIPGTLAGPFSWEGKYIEK